MLATRIPCLASRKPCGFVARKSSLWPPLATPLNHFSQDLYTVCFLYKYLIFAEPQCSQVVLLFIPFILLFSLRLLFNYY